jgi:RNA-directed DNA polymerase
MEPGKPFMEGHGAGRSCRDALAAIQSYIQKRAKYVIDADIAKCFDQIDHQALLDKIGMKGSFRKQLLYWLKAGVLDGNTFSETEMGTPQGGLHERLSRPRESLSWRGVISPLLANIALHGLEFHLQGFVKQFPMTYASGTKIKSSRKSETLAVVRYADDFVVMHHDKDVILACYKEIINWLEHVGLKISVEKTSSMPLHERLSRLHARRRAWSRGRESLSWRPAGESL